MVLMYENGLRERISQAIHRYAKANNKYMPNYDSQQLPTFLMYLDAKTYMDKQCVKSYLLQDLCGLIILTNMQVNSLKIIMK